MILVGEERKGAGQMNSLSSEFIVLRELPYEGGCDVKVGIAP